MSRKKKDRIRKIIISILLLILPTIFIMLLGISFMLIRIPTRIEIKASVNKVNFILGNEKHKRLINTFLKDISVTGFKNVVFEPLKMYSSNDYGNTWLPVECKEIILMKAYDKTLSPYLKFKGTDGKNSISYTLTADPGVTLTLKTAKKKLHCSVINNNKQEDYVYLELVVPNDNTFVLISSNVEIEGIDAKNKDENMYKVILDKYSPVIKIFPSKESLHTILKQETKVEMFNLENIDVRDFNFMDYHTADGWVSTLQEDADLTYPAFPHIKPKKISKADIIFPEKLKKFVIKKMILSDDHSNINIVLEGIAGKIQIGNKEFQKDYRLSIFDILWKNPVLVLIFTLIGWAFSTTVGLYKLYKEITLSK